MFDIIINGTIETMGLITCNLTKNNKGYVMEGLLKTHLYIEELEEIECSKFRISGIDVYAENMGSNDAFFVYAFRYEGIEVLNDGTGYSKEELIEMYEKESQ